jgi:hypothetical protein
MSKYEIEFQWGMKIVGRLFYAFFIDTQGRIPYSPIH